MPVSYLYGSGCVPEPFWYSTGTMPRPNPNRHTLNAYVDVAARDAVATLRAAVGVGTDASLCRVALAALAHRFGIAFPVEPGDVAALRSVLGTASAPAAAPTSASVLSTDLPPAAPLREPAGELPHELPETLRSRRDLPPVAASPEPEPVDQTYAYLDELADPEARPIEALADEPPPDQTPPAYALTPPSPPTSSSKRAPRAEKRRKPQRSLPEGWKPSEDLVGFGTSRGLSRADIELEAEKFVGHAQANDRRQADWDAAFRTWLIKAQEYRGASSPRRGAGRGGVPYDGDLSMLPKVEHKPTDKPRDPWADWDPTTEG